MSDGEHSYVAVLACGTRGDVSPLLALAIALHSRLDDSTVTLITHAAHMDWMQKPAVAAGVRLQVVASPPARVWTAVAVPAQASKRKLPDAAAEEATAADAAAREGWHREELVAACEIALASPKPRPRLIVFNLFALEGFHIAEALGVPCLAASPCLVPYAVPCGYERRFQQAHPRLYQRLQAPDEGQQQRALASNNYENSSNSSSSSVGWSEVRHWLWPLFTERWGAWRYHRLGLPSVPYSSCPSDVPLPPAPLLLYGVSESIIPRPGYWPSSVHMCGYWASQHCFSAVQQQLPPSLAHLLSRGEQQQPGEVVTSQQQAEAAVTEMGVKEATAAWQPICADFGSMGMLGLLPQPQLLVAVLQAAARRLLRQVLLLTAGWQPLLQACGCESSQQTWVLPLKEAVPHDKLLPQCAVLLHHGGAGTVAAALGCGTPQLVCPLHFDQQQWAERVVWLGCGAQISPAALLQAESSMANVAPSAMEPDSVEQQQEKQQRQQQRVEEAGQAVAAALEGVLQDANVQQQCAAMQQQLAVEDGLAIAVQLVHRQLQQAGNASIAATVAAGTAPGAAAAAAAPEPMPSPTVGELVLPDGLPILCISPPEALFIHREIFQYNCYRLGRGITLLPGSIVVDGGANVGLFALRLLLDPQLTAAVERLYAFEPLPPTADVLVANLRQHGVADKVSVLRCGLYSHPCSLTFMFYPGMPGNSTVLPGEKWTAQRPVMAASMGQEAADRCFQGASRVECPVTTLADFVREQGLGRIDLLKVDVEGCELEVLRGMDAAGWAITRQIVAEVHDVDDRMVAVKELLEGWGFAVDVEPGPPGNWLVFGMRADEARGTELAGAFP